MLLFQLILSLSLLIILHELGHFIPAKLFKTRVEKFYLFFDPYFSLIKKKVGETTYGIGWLPLGGYVKIAGMVDESMDKDQLDKPAEPWEFRSKPAWQRLIIMIGGVVVNIFVGCVIYSAILFTWGRDTLAVENATYGLHCHPIMYQYGFQDGDKIVAIDGVKPAGQEKVNKTILLDDPKSITVMRNNSLLDLQLPAEFGQLLVDSGVKSGCFMVRVPFVIQEFAETSGAKTAGLIEGDQIVGINEFRSEYYADLLSQLQKNKDTSVTIHYLRNGESGMLACTTDAEGKIGVMAVPPATFLNFTHLEYGIGSALSNGASEAWETVTDYASQWRFCHFCEAISKGMGLANFLGTHGVDIPDTGLHEYLTHPCFGRRSCHFPAVGNDHGPGCESKDHGAFAIGWHGAAIGLDALWQWHGRRARPLWRIIIPAEWLARQSKSECL
jgi:regulator of sigma E protease